MSANYRELVMKSNLTFIGIALAMGVFIESIFPVLACGNRDSGSTLPPIYLSIAGICALIKENPVLCAIVTALYYVASLRFKTEINSIINTGILFIFALLMFILGGPLVELSTVLTPLK